MICMGTQFLGTRSIDTRLASGGLKLFDWLHSRPKSIGRRRRTKLIAGSSVCLLACLLACSLARPLGQRASPLVRQVCVQLENLISAPAPPICLVSLHRSLESQEQLLASLIGRLFCAQRSLDAHPPARSCDARWAPCMATNGASLARERERERVCPFRLWSAQQRHQRVGTFFALPKPLRLWSGNFSSKGQRQADESLDPSGFEIGPPLPTPKVARA